MNKFEDDAINDDFEVEIIDLESEKETRPISLAIASAKLAERVSILRSRISFKALGDDADNASPDDDFELEITDLPANDEESRIGAAITALSSRISLSPYSDEPGDKVADDDLDVEITDLPATNEDEDSITSVGTGEEMGGREGNHGHLTTNLGYLRSRLPRKVRMLRQAIVGVAILLMLGVVLESVPSSRDALLGLFPRPTPTPTPAIVKREFGRFGNFYSGAIIIAGDISISSTPIAGATVIPWNPNTPIANVLDPPPQACPSANVPQDPDSVDSPYGNRVGGPPLWVMGFAGYFEAIATLTSFTRANPPKYGWARQVTLMLDGNAEGPVMLQGARLQDGTPLLFSDPNSGQDPTTFLTLNPGISSVSNPDGGLIGGIALISLYIPASGCYYLKASWAGGSWEAIFAAGR